MKTLTCTAPGSLLYSEVSKPALKKGHSIIQIRRIGICGTDLHAFEGTQPFFSYPRVLGHEISGELVEIDEAPGFKLGEQVTCIPYFNCSHCIACQMDKPNCCTNIVVCGVHIDGGMTEYLQVPSYALIHGNELSLDELATVEPLAIAAHGVYRANIQPGEFVVVIGAGPIGLGIIEFARMAGGQIIVVDINENRLRFCKEKIKIRYTINASEKKTEEVVRAITNGNFATVVIDATGSQRAIHDGFRYLAHGGRYILVGLQRGEIVVNHPEFHKREATLMSSRNATRYDFEYVIESIKKGKVAPMNCITHRIDFDELKNTFASLIEPENGIIKAMVNL